MIIMFIIITISIITSPHPEDSDLCFVDFAKYQPWPLGLYNPYTNLSIFNSLGVYGNPYPT